METRPPGDPGVPGDPGAGHFYPPRSLDWNGLSGPGGLHGGGKGREAPKAVEATPMAEGLGRYVDQRTVSPRLLSSGHEGICK